MIVTLAAKRRLAPLARAVAPHWFWRRKYAILAQLVATRSDVRLVRSLCDPDRISLDIGADVGEFTIGMLGSSRSVIAFEPRPVQAGALAAMFDAVGAAVRIEAVALSDRSGATPMRVLETAPGRSTIHDGNSLDDGSGSVDVIEVPVRQLDQLGLDDVGFIKIDVEGHELAVLHGGEETLRRNLPTLLVEAEERHQPGAVAAVAEFLSGLGYAGYFTLSGSTHPVETFNAERHQDPANVPTPENGWAPRGVYVNDFIFLPRSKRAVPTPGSHNQPMERRRISTDGQTPIDTLRQLPALVALERIPLPVLAVDDEGTILFANTAFADMLGQDPDDVVSLRFRQVFDQAPPEEATLPIMHALANLVVTLAHRDGSTVRALMSKSALQRDDDRVALVTFQDLTEQLWLGER